MSDLREQAERMVAERLGWRVAEHTGYSLTQEYPSGLGRTSTQPELVFWYECVRLQVELLTKPMP